MTLYILNFSIALALLQIINLNFQEKKTYSFKGKYFYKLIEYYNQISNSFSPKPHQFVYSPLQSGFLFNLDIENIFIILDKFILLLTYFSHWDIKWITNLLNALAIASPIIFMKSSLKNKLILLVFRGLNLYIIKRFSIFLEKVQNILIHLFISRLTLLVKNSLKFGPYISMRTFFADFYQNLLIKNNLDMNSNISIYLSCLGLFLMMLKLDSLILLGFTLFLFSNFLFLLDFTFWFLNNEKLKKLSPELHKFTEFFLLLFLLGSLFYFLGFFFKLIILLTQKFNWIMKTISNSLENYLVKMFGSGSGDHNSHGGPSQSNNSTGSGGQGGPGGSPSSSTTISKKKDKGKEKVTKQSEFQHTFKGKEPAIFQNTFVNEVVKDGKQKSNFQPAELYTPVPGAAEAERVRARTRQRERNQEMKIPLVDYNKKIFPEISKTAKDFYTIYANNLADNKGKKFTCFINFTHRIDNGEGEENWMVRTTLGLYKDHPELFLPKTPGATKITDKLLESIRKLDSK